MEQPTRRWSASSESLEPRTQLSIWEIPRLVSPSAVQIPFLTARQTNNLHLSGAHVAHVWGWCSYQITVYYIKRLSTPLFTWIRRSKVYGYQLASGGSSFYKILNIVGANNTVSLTMHKNCVSVCDHYYRRKWAEKPLSFNTTGRVTQPTQSQEATPTATSTTTKNKT